MKRTSALLAIGVSLGAIGCAAEGERIIVDQNAVGISYVEVERSRDSGDPILTVRGFDAQDEPIALLRLRTGMVVYTPEPGVIQEAENIGTELFVSVAGIENTLVTPDVLPHRLHAVPGNDLGESFLALPAVAAELESEAGITPAFERIRPGLDESALTTYSCWGGLLQNGAVANQCCFDYYVSYFTDSTETLFRTRDFNSVGHVGCKMSDGVTGGCNGAGCYYGPCGFANPNQFSDGRYWHVFDDSGSCNGGPFETNQPDEFNTVTGSCSYTNCVNGNPV